MRQVGLSILRRCSISLRSASAAAADGGAFHSNLNKLSLDTPTCLPSFAGPPSASTTKDFTRSFAVPKRKTSRHRRGMRFNHPSKRIRSKKVYSYCEKCDEVLTPHQICTGVLAGTCTTHLFQHRGGNATSDKTETNA